LFLFLPFILAGYFIVPKRLRNSLLLVASLFFYVWGEKLFVLVLLGSITVNYVFGLLIDRLQGKRAAGLALSLAVIANLGLLATYKYANFLVDNLNLVLARFHLHGVALAQVHLPLGISFFTFHALSYVIDVYRREVPSLKNPINFALYISFFPQSIAGPIVRYNDVAKQLVYRVITLEGFAEGVRRFILGLAKKMIIANNVAVAADSIFNLPNHELTAGLAWLGVVCYTLQIYFDFSGYSDMAIGLAKMFGFQFRENFNYPYIAQSITEFWRRWHISLSTWYRDYLYIPLGGNRHSTTRTYVNLVTVFFLCGLWHGASWTFILWGLFHGAFLVIERMGLGKLMEKTWAPVRHASTLLVVMVGWVLFKAATLPQALAFLGAMAGLGHGSGVKYNPSLYLNVQVTGILIAGLVASLPVLPWLASLRERWSVALEKRGGLALVLEPVLAFVPVMALALLLVLSAMFLAGGTYNPFIYYRF
jgi:alginate O-acetyltransferase complex protein AlgI